MIKLVRVEVISETTARIAVAASLNCSHRSSVAAPRQGPLLEQGRSQHTWLTSGEDQSLTLKIGRRMGIMAEV